MPTPTALLCRLIWCASLVIALIAATEANSRYRWWTRYCGASLLFMPFFWPELQGWTDDNYGWLIALFALRLIAALEAIQYQTRDLVLWGRLMGGIYLISFALCALIWGQHGFSTRDIAINLLHLGRIWTACVIALVQGFLWSQSALRNRCEDWATACIGALCIGRGITSVLALTNVDLDWYLWDIRETVFDSAAMIGWAIAISARSPLLRTALNRESGLG